MLEDPLEALDIYSSLITIIIDISHWRLGSIGQVTGLAYYSVKEYLVLDRIQKGQAARYSMQDVVCYSVIARGCLGYLRQFQKLEPMIYEMLKEFKLARYSAKFWMSHAQKTRHQTTEISRAAMDLLRTDNPVYGNWI